MEQAEPAAADRYYRKLRPFERPLYLAHLLSLGPEHRRLRFQGVISDEGIGRHARQLDFERITLIGCFVEGLLRGVGEVAIERDPAHPEARPTAELALSVDPALHGQGIGTALTRRAMRIARNRHVSTVWLYCLPENRALRTIVRKLGLQGEVTLHEGRLESHVGLPAPTLGTRLGESLEEGVGLWRSVSHLVMSRAP